MVFEKKMSVKDLIEQMRDELRKEQEEDGIVVRPAKKAKPSKKVKAKKAVKTKKTAKAKKKKK